MGAFQCATHSRVTLESLWNPLGGCQRRVEGSDITRKGTAVDLGTILVLGLSALLLVGFFVGTQYNRRRIRLLYLWLREGMDTLGEEQTVKAFGSAGFGVHMPKPPKPLRDMTLTLVLEPRETHLYWLLVRARGRRDSLIFAGKLRQPPSLQLLIANPKVQAGREALHQVEAQGWEVMADQPEPGLTMARRGPVSPQQAAAFLETAREVAPTVYRLSVRREAPHLILTVAPPVPSDISSTTMMAAWRRLAEMTDTH